MRNFNDEKMREFYQLRETVQTHNLTASSIVLPMFSKHLFKTSTDSFELSTVKISEDINRLKLMTSKIADIGFFTNMIKFDDSKPSSIGKQTINKLKMRFVDELKALEA